MVSINNSVRTKEQSFDFSGKLVGKSLPTVEFFSRQTEKVRNFLKLNFKFECGSQHSTGAVLVFRITRGCLAAHSLFISFWSMRNVQ